MGIPRHTVGRAAVAAVALSLLVGAGDERPRAIKAADRRPLKVAIVANNASEYWRLVDAGAKRFAREAKDPAVEFKLVIPPRGTADDQLDLIAGLDGYDGVAVAPTDPGAEADGLDALAAKTNVICLDQDAPTAKRRLMFVGTDNEAAGRVAGEQVVKLLPDGGQIGVFVGRLEAQNAADRLAGLEKAIAGHKIEIVVKAEDHADLRAARRNVTDALNQHLDLKLVVGLWSYNGPAIADVLVAAGRKGDVLAVAFDEERKTLDAVRDGTISCTVCSRPAEMGYQAVKWLRDFAVDGDAVKRPAGDRVDTGVDVVDAKSVDAFAAKLKAMRDGDAAGGR